MDSRRSFLNKSLLVAAGGLLSGRALSLANTPTQTLPQLAGRKVLFIYGGWDGHEPLKFRDYLVPWMTSEGADVSVFDNLEPYTDESFMESIDLVVQIHTMSSITREQEAGLLKAIKGGTGMAGWHGGMCDAFRQNVAYQYMTGGQWVAHPGGVIDYSVQITNKKDAISAGLSY